MERDAYIKSIIAKYALRTLQPSAIAATQEVYNIIQTWAGRYLLSVTYSGSTAKGTAICGIADVDLFISLSPDTPGTLADIYNSLANYSGIKHLNPRRQNVSVGIRHGNHPIDLVPGRKQSGNTSDHSLYRSKARSWTQTNIDKHTDTVKNSQRLDEIRAIKIWRALHKLEFPSFYLELSVIRALSGKRVGDLANNVWAVFEYLRDNLENALAVDPANANNKLSDDLTKDEKKIIARKATECLGATNWNQIIW